MGTALASRPDGGRSDGARSEDGSHVGCFIQTLWRPAPEVTPPVTPPVATLLRLLGEAGELGNAEIRQRLGLKDRVHVREHYLEPALAQALIELTVPDKPTSRLQKYRLTKKGHLLLAKEAAR